MVRLVTGYVWLLCITHKKVNGCLKYCAYFKRLRYVCHSARNTFSSVLCRVCAYHVWSFSPRTQFWSALRVVVTPLVILTLLRNNTPGRNKIAGSLYVLGIMNKSRDLAVMIYQVTRWKWEENLIFRTEKPWLTVFFLKTSLYGCSLHLY